MGFRIGKEVVEMLVEIQDGQLRARLAGEIIKLKKSAVGRPLTTTEQQTAEQICDWIESTWPENTVRAQHARKVARMIRAGEWKTGN